MLPAITGLAVGFTVLLLLFRGIELTRPVHRRLPVMRRGFWTDVFYWIFTSTVTRAATRLSVVLVLIPIALVIYGRVEEDLVRHGFGPAAQLPLWIQAVAILALSDFIGYWMHRWFHGRRMWRFHAIHHSSTDLDWLSSVRLHPVNDALMRVATTIPVLALGFAPMSAVGVVPVLIFMSIVIHANVDWDWGPFRTVLASPRFHRWHHTDETEALDKNFAGIFPLWDILFGTYYMPGDQRPTSFGTCTPVPNGLIGQLTFPFRKR
jgi:sterol desaturase/sphingolipid hydroxylase (fatty acid hydroxylase superfamily)